MADTLSKKARVDAAIKGEPVDRVPVSFWGHNYLQEWSIQGVADAMLDNYYKYDWDYMKVNPRASYHVEDWGARLEPARDPNKGPKWLRPAVTETADWKRLRVLDADKGVLGEQLEALQIISGEIGKEAYFAQTIFTPLSIANYLVAKDTNKILQSIREDSKALHRALEVITETFRNYAVACLSAGASGIFFATTGWASHALLTEEQYNEFGVYYDLQVIEVFKHAPFNILHNCGNDIMFDLLATYPLPIINWDSTAPNNPTLHEGKKRSKKAVMGGIREKTTLLTGTLDQVRGEVKAALDQTEGLHFLLAPGCSIPPASKEANLQAAREAVLR